MLFIIRNFLTKFAALNVIVIVLAAWLVLPTQANADEEDITIVPVVSLLLMSNPFSVTGGSVIEGDSGTKILNFTFKLNTYIENASVDYITQDGTATAGVDYEADSGTVTFSPGSLSVIVPITIYGDTVPEANETFSLILSNPVNLKLSVTSVTGTILDDDGPLNDTGITWGGNANDNNTTCTGVEINAQDCRHGRDKPPYNNLDGHAGFSYTKIGSVGQPLPASASSWSCVQDNVTGLIWEVKTNNSGLHDTDDKYTWYNDDSKTNGGNSGSLGIGKDMCFGYVNGDSSTLCNTQAYVKRVNNVGLCGETDWRMPSHKELLGIVSYDRSGRAIDTNYFPNTNHWYFWTGTPVANATGPSVGAWYVKFQYGNSWIRGHTGNYWVRLVRYAQ